MGQSGNFQGIRKYFEMNTNRNTADGNPRNGVKLGGLTAVSTYLERGEVSSQGTHLSLEKTRKEE